MTNFDVFIPAEKSNPAAIQTGTAEEQMVIVVSKTNVKRQGYIYVADFSMKPHFLIE